jgi:hypothetical protein
MSFEIGFVLNMTLSCFVLAFAICCGSSSKSQAAIEMVDFSAPLLDRMAKSTHDQLSKSEYVENLLLRNQLIYSNILSHFIYGGYPQDLIEKNMDRVLARAVGTLQADHLKIAAITKQLPLTIREVEANLNKIAGMASLNARAYLLMALTGDDGKASEDRDGKQAVVFNSLVLASYSELRQKNVIAHEVYHVAQMAHLGFGLEPTDVIRRTQEEGFAAYLGAALYPGLKESEIIAATSPGDVDVMKQKSREISGIFRKYADSRSPEILAELFSGNAKGTLGVPPKTGYYIGYQLARCLEKKYGVGRVLTYSPKRFRAEFFDLLKSC